MYTSCGDDRQLVSHPNGFTSQPHQEEELHKKDSAETPSGKTPGIRSKYGKANTTWNIVYDPRNDKVLTWTNHRVRIYRRRGHRPGLPTKTARAKIHSPGMLYRFQVNGKAATSL
jgi:hypothetical protein